MPRAKPASAPPPVRARKPAPARARETRSEQKARTRERIVRAAWELFDRDGYDATTTKAVAERARVAVGTVFVHARDKPELLFLVMSNMITESVDEAFRTLPGGAPFVEQVLHLFRGPVRYYARHPQVARAFLLAMPGADGPNAVKLNGETFAFLLRLAGVVSRAVERGELARDFEPQLAAQLVFGLYWMYLMAWVNGVVPIESVLEPQLRNALALLVRGIGAPNGASGEA
ncbi:MAG TPA: TetR/AcrR family transcriptional regulator [Polyangiaceae bacterium]